MGYLDEAIIYLSGPMEFAKDNGVGWRRRLVELAAAKGLKIYFIDPTNKPGASIGNVEDREFQNKLKKEGRFRELQSYVHEYRRLDLRYCDYIDALIVVIDPKIPSWGTADEVYTTEDEHKPMFVICEGGLKNLPNWLFDVFELDMVFGSVEEVVDELVKYNLGEKRLNNKWVLIRHLIKGWGQGMWDYGNNSHDNFCNEGTDPLSTEQQLRFSRGRPGRKRFCHGRRRSLVKLVLQKMGLG